MHHQQYGLLPLDFAKAKPANGAVSRRGFIVSSLASGFALAAGAAQASTIVTDSRGLIAGEVKIAVQGGEIPAYRAMPEKGRDLPVLLVIQEIFGVHEHIKDVCRRYAKLGYCAIAPELFARQGDVSKMSDIGQILGEVVSKVPDAQVMSDLDAAVAYAKGTGRVDVKRLGAVGYCWGGRTVWLYAAHNPQLKAGVAYYGLLNGMKSEIKPADPIDLAANIKAPVLGLYAGLDKYIKEDVVEQMRGLLAKGSSGSEVLIFPGVDHGFNADYRPTYDAIAAEYAAKLAREWLHDHGA
ncbi:carboxymethylenebutenolidase [Solimonas aquatica]|uniref:Carboxymethylenebutenolidase n=1 Tax=Solimonas aquatica TaxID=489703 RepID=A0A1H9KFP6_9GAMM|nr:dienelactone hydrolase family protein [Solimonas aquatica]SEQ97737.1 carboxymethylenebutenolidase [Solimonas aquatica]